MELVAKREEREEETWIVCVLRVLLVVSLGKGRCGPFASLVAALSSCRDLRLCTSERETRSERSCDYGDLYHWSS